LLLTCPADEIFIGGSLGGAKSHGLVMTAFYLALAFPGCEIGIFRQTVQELQLTIINKALELYPYRDRLYKYRVADKVMTFCNTSIITFGYLETDKDLARYQSREFDFLLRDEATHNTEHQIISLKKRVRSAHGYKTKIIDSGNPGGASHHYFYKRFMKNKDPYKMYETNESKLARKWDKTIQPVYQCFIKSSLIDNPYILENDPAYKVRLLELTESEREMYLYGNWEVNEGQFYKEWDEKIHIIDDYKPRSNDQLFISMDFGTAKPSAIGFFAIRQDRSVVLYKEIYTIRHNEPDVGTNESAEELANKIADAMEYEEHKDIRMMYLDNACWSNLGHGFTTAHIIMETLRARGCHFNVVKSTKNRIDGLQQVRRYMSSKRADGTPMFTITKRCEHVIRTIPTLIIDPKNNHVIDVRQEYHGSDMIVYLLITLPKPKLIDVDAKEIDPTQPGSFD